MTRILITGGTGFVARRLADVLVEHKYDVVVTTRRADPTLSVPSVNVGDINGTTDWHEALKGVDIVIHMAAQINPSGPSPEASWKTFMAVNRDGTQQLAKACTQANVGRFVYLSSILACGDFSIGSAPFAEDSPPSPDDGYGSSKRAAEIALLEICADSSMEPVILRPAPIYGPQLTNNILVLFKAVVKGLPLPIGSIKNSLDFIFVDNLISAILCVLKAQNISGKSYFICDQDQTSTPEFTRQIGQALGKRARIFKFPISLLRLFGSVTGRKFAVGRLTNSLHVDGSKITRELGWKPGVSLNSGLAETAKWYRQREGE